MALVNSVYFAISFHIDAPRADAFRHIKFYVEPYLDGALDLGLILENHHPRPLHALVYVLNASLFSLNYSVEMYIGLIALALIVLLVFVEYTKALPLTRRGDTKPRLVAALGFSAIVISILSLNNHIHYRWTLVTFGFLNTLIGLLIYYKYSSLFVTTVKREWVLYALTGILVLANFDRSIILLSPLLLLASFFLIIGEKKAINGRVLMVIVAQIIVVKLMIILWSEASAGGGSRNYLQGILWALSNPIEIIKFYAVGLSASLVEARAFREVFKSHPGIQLGVSIGILLVYLLALLMFIKRKMWKISVFPVALLLMPIIFMSAVLVSRYQLLEYQTNLSSSPRYLFNYHLGWAGVLWIYTLYYFQTRKIWMKALIVLLLLAVVISHVSVSIEYWKHKTTWFVSSATQSTLSVLQAGDGHVESLSHKQCPRTDRECLRVIKILKDNQMVSFSSRKSKQYLVACAQEVVSWKALQGGRVRFVFSNKVATMPISIGVNEEYYPPVTSFGNFKTISIKKDVYNKGNKVVFSCYKGGRFVPFDEVDLNVSLL
ncbi:MAG: hypothetical protein ACJAWS_001599 [Oleiphilaceae bacterium]